MKMEEVVKIPLPMREKAEIQDSHEPNRQRLCPLGWPFTLIGSPCKAARFSMSSSSSASVSVAGKGKDNAHT